MGQTAMAIVQQLIPVRFDSILEVDSSRPLYQSWIANANSSDVGKGLRYNRICMSIGDIIPSEENNSVQIACKYLRSLTVVNDNMVSQKLYPVHFLEYLTSIWTIKLFNRCCDICKDLRIEFPAIAVTCNRDSLHVRWSYVRLHDEYHRHDIRYWDTIKKNVEFSTIHAFQSISPGQNI